MPFIEVKPVIDHSVRSLCVKPYPGHPKGCPNFNKKYGCPPTAFLIEDMIDLSKPIFVIYNIFDIATHINNMRFSHPTWSERQLVCCLYWQSTARKQLKTEIDTYFKNLYYLDGSIYDSCIKIIQCPEASGVNVTATMHNVGIELEWPPRIKAYQIVLAGVPIR